MIRLAVPEDFTSIMSIYAYARSFMQETGNPNQWGNHFPPEELIHNRIRDKQLFVLEENGTLHGAFAFIIGEDPTYLQIDDGSWLSDAPYGTIHQVASDGTIHGFFLPDRRLLLGTDPAPARRYAYGQSNHAASDPENGFERRGIIYVLNHSPRIAFERVK